MVKYRFKTIQEFLYDFGMDWRHSVGDHVFFSDSMDPLLGQMVTVPNNLLDSNGEFSGEFNIEVLLGGYYRRFTITSAMLTKVEATENLAATEKPPIQKGERIRYRFLTEEEMIETYGSGWRAERENVRFIPLMDYLLGTPIDVPDSARQDGVIARKFTYSLINGQGNVSIAPYMLIPIRDGITYKKRKLKY